MLILLPSALVVLIIAHVICQQYCERSFKWFVTSQVSSIVRLTLSCESNFLKTIAVFCIIKKKLKLSSGIITIIGPKIGERNESVVL